MWVFFFCFFSPRILIPALHASPLFLSRRVEEKEMKSKRKKVERCKRLSQANETGACEFGGEAGVEFGQKKGLGI